MFGVEVLGIFLDKRAKGVGLWYLGRGALGIGCRMHNMRTLLYPTLALRQGLHIPH